MDSPEKVFQYLESTTVRKRFYRTFFDVNISGSATVTLTASYTNGTTDSRATLQSSDAVDGFNSTWDVGLWGQATFDASIVSNAYFDLTGTGDSISIIIYSTSAKDDIFTLKDTVYHYKPRRLLRGAR